MSHFEVTVQCPVHRSFRVEQLAGIFDVSLEEKLRESFAVELPEEEEDWQIGAIVGPSGSGKSTIAREAFGNAIYQGAQWPADRAVIDGFENRSIKEITAALTAVGFSSPPSWMKPYAVLSNGEKFRCDLARALLGDSKLVVYDEFSSVVDRTVGKIGSAAVAKAIRSEKIKRRFVAVTCHYDVLEWLQPDWVLDMASKRLARGRLRRPRIELEVAKVHHSAWGLFRRHHYLSGTCHATAQCFAAFWNQRAVGFSAWVTVGAKGRRADLTPAMRFARREHRTVVLPDYQGVGIGGRLSEFCASLFAGMGVAVYSTTGHPAVIAHRSRSPLWHRSRLGITTLGNRYQEIRYGRSATAAGRLTAGFRYIGPAMDRQEAEALLASKPGRFAASEAAERLLPLIRRWPGISSRRLAAMSGLSSEAVRRCGSELIETGQVSRQGQGKPSDPLAFYPAG